MHKGIKIALIVSLILTVAGVGFVVAGIALGGHLNFQIDTKNRKILSADESLVRGTLTPEPFTELDVEVATADISVSRGEGWALEYALTDEPEIAQTDGRLTLKGQERAGISFVGISVNGDGLFVRITVPEAAELEAVTLHTATGDVKLSDLEVQTIAAECSTGDMKAQGIRCGKLDLVSNTGDIDVKDTVCTGDVTLEGNTGDVNVQKLAEATAISVETNTGDIAIALDDADYALDFETDTGDLTVNGRDQGHRHSTDGTIPLHAETNTGDLTVRIG